VSSIPAAPPAFLGTPCAFCDGLRSKQAKELYVAIEVGWRVVMICRDCDTDHRTAAGPPRRV